MKKFSLSFSLLLIGIIFSTKSFAVLEVNIYKDKLEPIPVLVGGFSQSKLFKITQIISQNLSRNKDFAVQMDTAISYENFNDNLFSQIAYREVDIIVLGKVEVLKNNLYKVSYQLIDYYLQKPISQNSWQIPLNMMDNIAHKISDEIYLTMLGYSGDFASKIAYVTYRKNGYQNTYTLEIADSDGKNAKTTLKSNQPILSPAWSNDGSKIAYVSFETGRSRVYIQDIYTKRKRFILPDFNGISGAPAFSPDDLKIAVALSYRGNQDIYIYDLRDGKMQRITSHTNIDTEPVWSNDGKYIYFTSDRSKVPQIYKINLSNRQVQRISFSGRNNSSASLSKDDYIAMVEGNYGDFHISLLDSKNNNIVALTKGKKDESPSFSPNGKKIIFATNENNKGILSTISLVTGVRNNLILTNGEIREPAWGPALK